MLLLPAAPCGAFVLFTRRFLMPVRLLLAVLLLINARAEAQGIGFQGGVTRRPGTGVRRHALRDRRAVSELPVQAGHRRWVRRRFLARDPQHRVPVSLRVRPVGGACIRAAARPWSSCGRTTDTSVHARHFFTFGFAHENGFFTDFKLGNGNAPTLKFGVGYTVRKRTP